MGALDGTLIKLQHWPSSLQRMNYYSWKQKNAITLQVSVNWKRKFTSYKAGWPGSMPNTQVIWRVKPGVPSQGAT